MIKALEKRFTYFESEQRFELEINNKKVIAFRYEKQDPQFNDYEVDIEIKDKDKLTETEIEEIEDFINEGD